MTAISFEVQKNGYLLVLPPSVLLDNPWIEIKETILNAMVYFDPRMADTIIHERQFLATKASISTSTEIKLTQ